MTTITPTIVTLNTVVTVAPSPSQLQQSGALISVGGTTLSTGAYQYVGQQSDLLEILSNTGNYAELTNMGSTFFAQGTAVGVYVLELGTQSSIQSAIAALSTWLTDNPGVFYAILPPADWDTIPAAAAPALSSTSGGSLAAATYYVKVTYLNSAGAEGETSAEASLAVLVDHLLVVASPPALSGATEYNVYISTTTGEETLQNVSPVAVGTGWTLPTSGLISGVSPPETLADLASDYASPSGLLYFFPTTSQYNVLSYAANKAVFAVVPSPSAQSEEFQAASIFYQWLVNSPSAANQLAGMAYRFLYGVTPWANVGNSSAINSILTNYGNIISTGAEGGITNAGIFKGTLQDQSQASWWYGVDWFQIQVKRALAAAIYNSSNQNPPIVYNQNGINSLLAVAEQVANSAVSFLCALSVTITAQDFATYTSQNPDNYKAGIYGGFLATVVGQNSFLTLVFNIDAVEFA